MRFLSGRPWSAAAVCLLVAVITLCASPGHSNEPATTYATDSQTWTVMVYMAADAYPEIPWEPDINEMEAASQAEGVTTVALVDPLGPGNSVIYRIDEDPFFLDPTIVSTVLDGAGVLPTDGEADMADPATLTAFVSYSTELFPADRYVLVLWGHGGGWLGICPDGLDLMTLPELRAGLEDADQALGRTIDVIVADACAEATVEVAYEIRETADYLVASERYMSVDGLPYTQILGDLAAAPDMSPEQFSRTVVDRYTQWAEYGSSISTTMAAFDLSAAEGFVDGLSELSLLGARYDGLFDDQLFGAYSDADRFEDPLSMDAGDFLAELARSDTPVDLRYTAGRVLLEFSAMVFHSGLYVSPEPVDSISAAGASGAAIFVDTDMSATDYADLAIAATPWPRFAELAMEDSGTVVLNQEPEYSAHDSDADGDELDDAVTFTWDLPAAGTYEVWVFSSGPNGLTHVTTIDSDLPEVTVAGIAGRLVLSAVGCDMNGSAISYLRLDISLYQNVTVEVRVDATHLAPDVEFDVYLMLDGGPRRMDMTAPGTYDIAVTIPEDALPGQMVSVEVLDRHSGDVLGWNWTVFTRYGASADVQVFENGADDAADLEGTIVLAALVSAAVIAVALFLIVRRAKGRR